MSDRAGIEAAIQGFLRLGGALDHSTGILKEWQQTQAFLDEVPGGFDSAETSVRKLEIVREDGETALVDLDANRQWTATDLLGRPRNGSDHFTGPVELVRANGVWKVRDIVRDGVSLRQSTFRPTLSVSRGDLNVRALMGRFDGSVLRVVFESVYRGSRPAELLGSDMAIRSALFRWTWSKWVIASCDQIPHGESRFFVDAVFKSCLPQQAMRVVFRTDRGVLELQSGRTATT